MTMRKARVTAETLIAERYRLREVLWEEPNRVCWYAEDTARLRPRLLTQYQAAGGWEEDAVERIVRSSEAVSTVMPRKAARVIDVAVEPGCLWTVVEWIDGTPLGELAGRQKAFSLSVSVRIALHVLDVLEAAHFEGVVHGDLSPGQVFVEEDGVVVTGFGPAAASAVPRLGAPAYASPEQASGEGPSPAGDLWGLGALLYTMVEGRAPVRERREFAATLRAVERARPCRPRRAGPLAWVIEGLLATSPAERLTASVVRGALAGVLDGLAEAGGPMEPLLGGPAAAGGYRKPSRRGRVTLAAALVAAVTAATAVAAMTLRSGTTDAASDAAASPSPSPTEPGAAPGFPAPSTDGAASTPPRSAGPSPEPSATASDALPAGYRVYRAPEGFRVALPEGWERVGKVRDEGSYRVLFGTERDDRTLAVTYTENVGPDPVVTWRDGVQPQLRSEAGFRRLGDIRALTYQGRRAADMEWVAGPQDDRERTLGRGFVIGEGQGFSLRWTTPADEWSAAGNQQALRTFLRTFRWTAA
jgi:hypothetical protein